MSLNNGGQPQGRGGGGGVNGSEPKLARQETGGWIPGQKKPRAGGNRTRGQVETPSERISWMNVHLRRDSVKRLSPVAVSLAQTIEADKLRNSPSLSGKPLKAARSHKIALKPTTTQEHQFRRAAGIACFTRNWGLAEWNRQYKARPKSPVAAIATACRARIAKGPRRYRADHLQRAGGQPRQPESPPSCVADDRKSTRSWRSGLSTVPKTSMARQGKYGSVWTGVSRSETRRLETQSRPLPILRPT